MHYGTFVLQEPNGHTWQVDDFDDDLSARTLARVLRLATLNSQSSGQVMTRYLPTSNVEKLLTGD